MVSIIIPCFNAELWIRETLASVATQDIDDIETIVIDDGSTDRTGEVIASEFKYVNLIRTKNQGPGKARNLGTKISKGEFIQYLDADDLLAPGKLRVQLEALQNSNADVAYGNWQKLVKNNEGFFTKKEEIKKRLINPEIDLFTDFWCPPAVYLFRRSIVEKVGSWQEDLPICEDVRFILDCVFKGANFVYCEGIMAYFRSLPEGESLSTRDPMLFTRCCLRNAFEIEKRWENIGGITEERKKALLKAYGYVARASFEKDKNAFETAYRNLERLYPGYVPERPRRLRLASKLFGYRRAESIALSFRKIKSCLRFLESMRSDKIV